MTCDIFVEITCLKEDFDIAGLAVTDDKNRHLPAEILKNLLNAVVGARRVGKKVRDFVVHAFVCNTQSLLLRKIREDRVCDIFHHFAEFLVKPVRCDVLIRHFAVLGDHLPGYCYFRCRVPKCAVDIKNNCVHFTPLF